MRLNGALPVGRAFVEAARYWGARKGLFRRHQPLPFVIACCPRSGSTAVQRALNLHPNIVCMHELMNRDLSASRYARRMLGRRHRLSEIRRDAPECFLEEVLGGIQPRHVFAQGFKAIVTQPHGGREARQAHWRLLGRIEGLRVVWITRPRLASVLSFVMARASGNWIDRPLRTEPVRLDTDYLMRRLAAEDRSEAHARQILASKPFFELDYSRLCATPSNCLRDVEAFLGVPESSVSLPTRSSEPPRYENVVENWSEVIAALRRTRWKSELTSLDSLGNP